MHTRLASIVLAIASMLSAPALAQDRCDCAAATCVPATPDGATLRGRVVEARGRDANDRVEHYLALVPARPVCAVLGEQETPPRHTATRADRLQLILTDVALRARVRAAVGREITVRGTILEQLTAHHHTPLMLDVTATVDAASDTEGRESRAAITGSWRVTEYLRSNLSALSDAEARRMVGRSMRFVGPLSTPWGGCARPTLRRHAVTVETFLNDARVVEFSAERARGLGLHDGSLDEWTATCGDAGAPTTFYATSAGAVLVGRDGVWFVLRRGRR